MRFCCHSDAVCPPPLLSNPRSPKRPGLGHQGGGSAVNVLSLASLLLGHLGPSVIPRFIDDDRDLLRCAFCDPDLCYCAAANLSRRAAQERPLELDGLPMGSAAEGIAVVTAWVFRGHEVVPGVQ